jgi:hypothetical protein
MGRFLTVAILSAALLAGGCATKQASRLSEDPDTLVETIVRRGLGDRKGCSEERIVSEPERAEISPFAAKCLETTGKICGACLVLGAGFGLLCLAVAGGYHGPIWLGSNPTPE